MLRNLISRRLIFRREANVMERYDIGFRRLVFHIKLDVLFFIYNHLVVKA